MNLPRNGATRATGIPFSSYRVSVSSSGLCSQPQAHSAFMNASLLLFSALVTLARAGRAGVAARHKIAILLALMVGASPALADTFGTNPAATPSASYGFGATVVCGGTFGASAGTLGMLSVYLQRFDATFRFGRAAIYQGGASSTDPAGATLVWDSGNYSVGTAGFHWEDITAGGESLSANTLTWIALRTDTSWSFKEGTPPDDGDLTLDCYSWSQTNSATAFEATIPAVSLFDTDVFAAYLTFTAGGGGGSSNIFCGKFCGPFRGKFGRR